MKRQIISVLLAISILLPFSPVSYALETVNDSMNLLLVNKTHTINESHKASDMVSLGHSDAYMRAEAAEHMTVMLDGIKAAGLPVPRYVSGYRSYARQRSTFNTRINKRLNQGYNYEKAYEMVSFYTAPPGTSEHQTGLAMDLSMDGTLTEAFGKTPSGKWLAENSWRYGYILRYTSEKSQYTMIGPESWHFRYVGTPHAEIMYKNGWCFEEYLIALCGGSIVHKSDDGYIYTVRRAASLPTASSGIVSASSDNMGAYIITSRVKPSDIPVLTADIPRKIADIMGNDMKIQ